MKSRRNQESWTQLCVRKKLSFVDGVSEVAQHSKASHSIKHAPIHSASDKPVRKKKDI
jgi:hypothetical protein